MAVITAGNEIHRTLALIASTVGVLLAAMIFAGASASASTSAAFSNSTPIVVPDKGQASPYPSRIDVQGMPGRVTDVNVRLLQFEHARTLDVDILLVSPDGNASIVMSNTCGSFSTANATWTFDQEAALPIAAPCDQFIYQPADVDTPTQDTGDSWPGFTGDHAANFDRFIGANPNGSWRLYVVDDRSFNPPFTDGRINGGWTLTIETAVPDAVVPASGTVGPANPYPVTRTVSGMSGVIKDVDVHLSGVFHGKPDDLDLVLVGPQGQNVMLMSDACGTTAAKNANWGWDDEAAAPMADAGPCPTNTAYRPTEYEFGEGLPAPAPARPYGSSLAAFDSTDPNGEWRLYVDDDRADGTGFFVNRFDLQIETGPRPDAEAPETTIEKGPKRRTERRTVRLRFSASELGSTFECKLDRREFKPCASPRKLKRLRPGKHTFRVRAIDPAGNVDPTPAKRRWRIVR